MPALSLVNANSRRFRRPRISLTTLLYRSDCSEPEASALGLSPVGFSAQARLTSELLRFL